MTAVAALHEQLSGVRCSTSSDCMDGAKMTGQKPGAVFFPEGVVILIEDRGKLHDHILLKSTWRVLISPLIVSNAFCSAASVR